jgi:tRNA G10  N-methylase Trm11
MSYIGNKYELAEFNPALGRLVTPGTNRKQPVYRWYVYPHSFARELVQHVLDELELKPGSIVLDPCVGAGSTVLSCKERGVSAIGYDILPLSVLITNVKARDYHVRRLRETWESFLLTGWNTKSNGRRSNVLFLRKAFNSMILGRIYQIREAIRTVNNLKYRQLFLLGLAATVGEVSKTAKGGGWLRLMPDKACNVQDVDSIFMGKVEKMIEDLEMSPIRAQHPGIWRAYKADARLLPDNETFSAVITSPPYLNRHDYTRIFLLELAIPFLMTEPGLKRLRYKTLRSHIEAKRQFDNGNYSQPSRLVDVLRELQDRPLNNATLPDMIAGYFEDMYLMLHELHRVTNPGGRIVFVLGNVRFGGVTIPVDEITAEIGEQAGFQWENTTIARYRGNSAQQMGIFSREPSRESLIYWCKPW